jgi:hypothetical protein
VDARRTIQRRADIAINELPTREQQAIFAEFEAVGQLPGVLQGNQLQPATTASTVRMCDGQTEVASSSANVERSRAPRPPRQG